MTWVKVCGLTQEADVAYACEAGADAVGFVNVPQSPRYVPLDRAASLAKGATVPAILLTFDLSPAAALEVLSDLPFVGIQPYGVGAGAVVDAAVAAGFIALRPLRAAPAIATAGKGIPLVDTPAGDRLGGTGHSFDWGWVEGLETRFVLAGGLNPENVGAAIAQVRPWGVDASSGLEQSPGVKDHSRVAAFIQKAKEL